MSDPPIKEIYQSIIAWCKRRIFANKDMIELADAIGFGGVEIVFEQGKIVSVKPWQGIRKPDLDRIKD